MQKGGTELDQRAWELGWECSSTVTDRKERRRKRETREVQEMSQGQQTGRWEVGKGQGRKEEVKH